MRVTNDTNKRMLGRVNRKLYNTERQYSKTFSAFGHVLDKESYEQYKKEVDYIRRLRSIRRRLKQTVKWV